MRFLKRGTKNDFIRLIALLTIECFIVTLVAPDYEIRDLFCSKEQACARLSLALGNHTTSLTEGAPNALVPPLKTWKGRKGKPQPATPGADGLCVTADTLLPIVKVNSPQSISYSQKTEIKLKPIVEVRPGDYVLSLNEETGKIVTPEKPFL